MLVKKKKQTINLAWHPELVSQYDRLRNEVNWLKDAGQSDRLRDGIRHYQRAVDIADQLRREKKDGNGIGYKAMSLAEDLWESIRAMLRNHGYDKKWFIHKDGKVGLRQVWGINPAIPPLYDEILITYDGYENMRNPIPVRLGDKCGLVSADGLNRVICPFEYDLIFREPWSRWPCYIARKDGKWGIITSEGKETVPCIMDHIYGRNAHDGVILLEKDGKFGAFNDWTYAYPEYENGDMIVDAESMVKVCKNGQWGWLDMNGQFTMEEKYASFSNYEDDEK